MPNCIDYEGASNQPQYCVGNHTATITNYADGHWTLEFDIEANPGDSHQFRVCPLPPSPNAPACGSGSPNYGPYYAYDGSLGLHWSGTFSGAYTGGLRLNDGTWNGSYFTGVGVNLPTPS